MNSEFDKEVEMFDLDEILGPLPPGGEFKCICECKCEESLISKLTYVFTGEIKLCNCACLRKFPAKTGAYRRLNGMISRCFDPENLSFHRYGGRGITIHEPWLLCKLKLYKYLDTIVGTGRAEDYFKLGYEIDRKNNDGNYEPGNLRIVTSKINSNNKSDTVFLVVEGLVFTVAQASEHYGLNPSMIQKRIKKGWTDEECIFGRREEPRSTDISVDFEGEKWSLKSLCEKLGKTYSKVHGRYRNLGWSLDEALEFIPRSDGRCKNEIHEVFGESGTLIELWDKFNHLNPNLVYTDLLRRFRERDMPLEDCFLVQARKHRGNSIKMIVRGESLILAQVCRKYGVTREVIKYRLDKGWTDEESVFGK